VLLLSLLGASCTCDGEREEGPEGERADPPATWLRVCFEDPSATWSAFRALAGDSLDPYGAPADVGDLAARLTGLPREQLAESVDFDRPLSVVLSEPTEDQNLYDTLALVGTRKAGPSGLGHGEAVGRRELDGPDGTKLHLHAGRDLVGIARTTASLEAGLAAAGRPCATGPAGSRPDVVAEVAPELLQSEAVGAWVERHGAQLEASARQATARRGRSTLGDPEALARWLGRLGQDRLRRAGRAAPLRIDLSLGPEGLDLTATAEGGPAAEAPEASPRAQLALLPPDAYLVVATHASGEDRAAAARRRMESLGRVAGEHLEAEDRERLEASLVSYSEAISGWMTVALRPGLEPGPAIVLVVAECSDPRAAGEALAEVVGHVGEGYLHEVLDHLGAAVTVHPTTEPEGVGGTVRLAVSTPEWVTDERGQTVRLLLGEAPSLAWQVHGEGTLLAAFGPDSARELGRLREAAAAGSGGASVLTQPAVTTLSEPRAGVDLFLYMWTPHVAALPTRGAPGAGGMPRGGLALAADAPDGRGRLSLRMDGEQVRSLLSARAPRRRR